MTCMQVDCFKKAKSRGYCAAHYQRARVTGEIVVDPEIPVSVRIKAYSKPNPETGCWEWQRYRKPSGYGTIAFEGKPYYHAHRASYAEFVGPIPDGMWVLHKCDNRPCVNPDHLFLGSMQDNVDDRNRKKRQARGDQVGTSKLTWPIVRQIKNELAAGQTCREIGKRYSVHKSTIERIRSGESWKGDGPTTAA